MAIDEIKKAIFLVPNYVFEDFLLELKKSACVEIIQQKDELDHLTPNEFLGLSFEQIKTAISKIETIFTISTKYLKNIKIKIPQNFILPSDLQFKKLDNFYSEIETLDNQIKTLQTNLQKLENKESEIQFFSGIEINLSYLEKLKDFYSYFLKIDVKKEKQILSQFKEIGYIFIIKKIKEKESAFVIIHKDYKDKFQEIVKKFDVQITNLKEEITSLSLEEELKKISLQIENIKQQILNLTQQIQILLKQNLDFLFEIYYQCLELKDFFIVQQEAQTTKYIKFLHCWVPKKFIKRVNSLLNKFQEISALFFEPQKGEDIPTVLFNKSTFEPYEYITTLYGLPKPNSVDPTEFLAPFFTIFFALCLSDIFYGILLVLLWYLLRKKVPNTSEYYKLVVLFKYLGICSIAAGIFLDSFLGISIFKNFKFPINLAIFDPLNKPIDMLKFTFILGYIQINFGLIINSIKNIKNKEISEAVDSISWVFFITAFAPVVYNLFFPKEIKQSIINISVKLSSVLFLFIVVYQSRKIKLLYLKPINFFVKAYNTIGFYADILSYARILALALATSAIAQTINILVVKLIKADLFGIKIIEPIFAPIVFLVGHIFNFLMGCLGAFVHSARLQFLEFFSKFFVAGGRPIKIFAPLRRE